MTALIPQALAFHNPGEYTSACYQHCWKDLHLILNTQVRIITKIMEDSLSLSQQEQHHYFIHLWACRCTDTRQIIFLINQCSIFRSLKELTAAKGTVVAQAVAAAWPSPLTWQGCPTIPCLLHATAPHICYPIKQENNAVKTQRREAGFQTCHHHHHLQDKRDRWWPFPWRITGLSFWMGECRWQLKIRPSSVTSGRRHNGMKAVVSFSFLIYQCYGTTGSFTAEN